MASPFSGIGSARDKVLASDCRLRSTLHPSEWIIFLQLADERASERSRLSLSLSRLPRCRRERGKVLALLTLFDYKLTARLSPVPVSSTGSPRRPTPSGLSSIEPRCDGPVPMAAWSLLSEWNIVSRAPAWCLGESNCNKRDRSLDIDPSRRIATRRINGRVNRVDASVINTQRIAQSPLSIAGATYFLRLSSSSRRRALHIYETFSRRKLAQTRVTSSSHDYAFHRARYRAPSAPRIRILPPNSSRGGSLA